MPVRGWWIEGQFSELRLAFVCDGLDKVYTRLQTRQPDGNDLGHPADFGACSHLGIAKIVGCDYVAA